MGILTDGNANLVLSGLTLYSGTPSAALAVWVRNPAVSAGSDFLRLRNAGTTTAFGLNAQSNTVLGGSYVATGGDSAYKTDGNDENSSWKPMMVFAYSSTGGSTIDRLRFWSGAATTGVEDTLGPAKSNNMSLLTVIEAGVGDSADIAEMIVLTGLDLTAAQTFWTAFKAGATLPETIDPAHTVTWATLKDMTSGSLTLGNGLGTLAATGAGTIVASTTAPTHPITRTAAGGGGPLNRGLTQSPLTNGRCIA